MKNTSSQWGIWVIAVALGVLSSADSAVAYWSWPFVVQCDDYCEENVPYFVAHPPVQYGYSILNAWVPDRSCSVERATRSARRPAPAPLLVINPYCSDDAGEQSVAVETARRPLRIINPFVESPDSGPPTQSEISIPAGMLLEPILEPILP